MASRTNARRCWLLTGALLCWPGSLAVASPMFQGLGDLPGGDFFSQATGVSGDGAIVVGVARSANGGEAFRWSAETGIEGLGTLQQEFFGSTAHAISQDGAVVVGVSAIEDTTVTVDTTVATGTVVTAMVKPPSIGSEAFRWTSGQGMVGIGQLPGGAVDSVAYAASGDGSTIVGRARSATASEAFRWTPQDGVVGLGTLPDGDLSIARGVSGNGSIVVGEGRFETSVPSEYSFEAFRWTEGEGMIGLGDLPGGPFRSTAFAISSDGSTIIGESDSASGHEAFLWTDSAGMRGLGDLPGSVFNSAALAVSADGSVVVGTSVGEPYTGAFVWDAKHGMRSVKQELEEGGLDLSGWQLTRTTGVSADGRTLIGWGFNPAGDNEAWIATLPEPGTGLLLCWGLLLAARGRRARPRARLPAMP